MVDADLLTSLISEVASLRQEMALLREENARLRADNLRLEKENFLLRQKLDALARRLFGKSSEAIDEAQLHLLLYGAEQAPPSQANVEIPAVPPKAPSKRRRTKPDWSGKVEVVEEIVDPLEVQSAPEQWRKIGEEVQEQLDYQPARLFCRRLVRNKYVQRHNPEATPKIAPLPAGLQERCQAAPGLIASIIVGKYCDHLPLYRQEQIFDRRFDVFLSRQTLSNWVGLGAHWLGAIYRQIAAETVADGYVQIDETPVRYLAPGNGKTKQGYFWVMRNPVGETVFMWKTSRAAECLNDLLPCDFKGVVQCDGYSAYTAFFNQPHIRVIEVAGCWAHARRAFYEAREQQPRRVALMLHWIGELYKWEREWRENRAGPALRKIYRASKSRIMMRHIHRVLKLWKGKDFYLPQSAFGKAVQYMVGQWDRLTFMLEDGRVEIDNNLVENAIRPTAVGKKNWLFIGEANAGDNAAVLYTIIESCKKWEIDPWAYLKAALTRLPNMTNQQIAEITPKAWAKEQKEKAVKPSVAVVAA